MAKKFWWLLFWINAASAAYVWRHPELRLMTHFNYGGVANGFMSGRTYAIFILSVLSIANLVIHKIFQSCHHVRVLDKMSFPNKEYWMSSPDRQIDVLFKMRDYLCGIGLWLNVIFLFAQLLIYFANFDPEKFKLVYPMGFMGALASMVLVLLLMTWQIFKVSK